MELFWNFCLQPFCLVPSIDISEKATKYDGKVLQVRIYGHLKKRGSLADGLWSKEKKVKSKNLFYNFQYFHFETHINENKFMKRGGKKNICMSNLPETPGHVQCWQLSGRF